MLVQTHTSYFTFNKRMEKGKLETESYFVVMRMGTKLYFLRMYSSSVTGFWKSRFPSPRQVLEHINSIFIQHFQLCRSVWFIN